MLDDLPLGHNSTIHRDYPFPPPQLNPIVGNSQEPLKSRLVACRLAKLLLCVCVLRAMGSDYHRSCQKPRTRAGGVKMGNAGGKDSIFVTTSPFHPFPPT